MNDAERDLTKLLLEARLHHTRITMEELPVGRVVIGQTGVIESIDSWTENILDFAQEDLRGRSLVRIFPELALQLFELMSAKQFGLAGQTNLRTRGGRFIAAQVVVIPAAEPQGFVCEIIFATAN